MYGEACSAVPLYKAKKDELNHRDMKSRYLLLFYFSCTCGNAQKSKTPPNFGQKKKSFFTFNQSAYNKQWLGAEHLTWLVILVLTTTSTIKGAVVWDNKFILIWFK
jgi:hypothetical protein